MWDNLTRVLEGDVVRLEPLERRHEQGLFGAAGDERIWTWIPSPWTWIPSPAGDGSRYPAASREAFRRWMDDVLARSEAGGEAAFATVDARTGEPIGSTRFLALRPEHRGLEIGWTWLTPSRWRTGANVEAKLLMLQHAFERLGCIRVELKTDRRNERSRKAMEALPAHFEGVFRKHMLLPNGDVRDSAYYSITDDDWPEVAANLRRRLAGITAKKEAR